MSQAVQDRSLAELLQAEPDLVDRIFDYIVSELPEVASKAPDLKERTRAEFAGVLHYIGKKSPVARQQELEQVLRMFNGRNASEIARRLGIGRTSVYRYLKQAGHRPEVMPASQLEQPLPESPSE